MPRRDQRAPALLIGRWVTPHAGHVALIKRAIEQYGSVVIAFRRTKEQPVVIERRGLLEALLRDAGVRAADFDFIVIPDISAVVYGRDVGYDLCEFRLDEATESIRGEDLRG